MFELSIARKYLLPRWRQLSVSIISLISVCVIALVVWLVLVFLSVIQGIEDNWIKRLVAFNGPLQATPTEAYYNSYYHRADTISNESDYHIKTLFEKLQSEGSDPHDPELDMAIPVEWPEADRDPDGTLRDPVKEFVAEANQLKGVKGLRVQDFELGYAQMRLRLLRHHGNGFAVRGSPTQRFLSPQSSYLVVSSFDEGSPQIRETLLPPSVDDLTNLLYLLSISGENLQEDKPTADLFFPPQLFHERLRPFFEHVTITQLMVGPNGWIIPFPLLPKEVELRGCAIALGNGYVRQIILPQDKGALAALQQELQMQGERCQVGSLRVSAKGSVFTTDEGREFPLIGKPLTLLARGTVLDASFVESSLAEATQANELEFSLSSQLQGHPLVGEVAYSNLKIGKAEVETVFDTPPAYPPLWIHQVRNEDGSLRTVLPDDPQIGRGVLVAERYRTNGVLLGDRGYLNYSSAGTSAVQEQRIPLFIAGFFDVGVLPIGPKSALVDREVTTLIRSSLGQQDNLAGNGFSIWFDNPNHAAAVKAQLQARLQAQGIDHYWHLETWEEYEFSRGLAQQFQSDRVLFSLIALIIIIVACANIISMLIILVNDKKKEIGILLAMGASSRSIALIFGFCGMVMGILGTLLGTVAALLTLKNLKGVVSFISTLQGHEAFNPAYYGKTLPNQVSYGALLFVIITTILLSLIAGIVPALKASMQRPSSLLRSDS